MAAAARLSDPIGHSPTMSWLLTGLLAGAAIGIGAALIFATGGLAAAAIIGGAAASGAGVMELASTMSFAPKAVVGAITATGAVNVFANGLAVARAHLDFASCSKHPAPATIATGSGQVFINSMPAARVDDKTICSAVITEGSSNVNIGGGTVQTDEIHSEDLVPGWLHATLLVVGIGSAFVLAAPAVVIGGLVLGGAAAFGGGMLGGAIFGEGSDGQKLMAFGGGILGGLMGAKGASAWMASRSPQPTISLYGFRGAGHPDLLKGPDAPHPYRVTGHVGYSLDDGKTIWGYGPHIEGKGSAYDAVASLRRGDMYPGKVTNDTDVFIDVARNPGRGRDGVPQVVYEQKIPMTRQEYDAVVAAHDARPPNVPMDDLLYGFPKADNPNPCAFNCATYPSKLGIPIPEETGNMRSYVPALKDLSKPWKP